MSQAFRLRDELTTIDLDAYFERAAREPRSYRGQLAPEFQQALRDRHKNISFADCDFYHTANLPNGDLIKGEWDLRHSEAEYVGRCSLEGKRVIEFGPASGGLSNYIVRQGAELVVFDLPFGASPELVPFPEIDMDAQRASGARSAARLRNSWWYMKQAVGFAAQAVYGDIYDLPDDLGRFDIATFGSILLHLSHPFRALQQASAITSDTIVVTDVSSAPGATAGPTPIDCKLRDKPSLMVFNPTRAPAGLIHWWALSPDVITHMLRQLGFLVSEVTTHSPVEMTSRPALFTVVAHRRRMGTGGPIGEPYADLSKTETLPVPTSQLRFQVSGTEDLNVFLTLGKRAFEALTQSLRQAKVDVGNIGRVLDFGCGAGRVLRHWGTSGAPEVHGTDFNHDAIAWASDNLPFATVKTNLIEGPLDYPDGYFGFIYALSVFTHLPKAMQKVWFAELVRLLRPGGFLYFTTHGEHYAGMLNAEQLEAFQAGEIVVTGDDQPGTNHCAAFHPPSYLLRELPGSFNLTLRDFKPCGAKGNPDQDSYLFQKTSQVATDQLA